jgi:TolB-like protein
MMMKKLILFYTFTGLIFLSGLNAQINVAVTRFSNNSNVFYLDSWENTVPDLLRSELAQSKNIVIVERDKLAAIFEEQKLALAGFIDSSNIKNIGQLAGADFMISGNIQSIDDHIRIDASITRVKSGEVHIERAVATSADHLDKMIELLANNIKFYLTGQGKYRESVSVSRYPTLYFLGATAGFAAAGVLFNQSYIDNKQKYDNAGRLKEFDKYYDDANNARRLSIIMASLGGTALIGTIYCWIKNHAIEDVSAGRNKQVSFYPGIRIDQNDEVQFSVQIHF